MRKSAAPWPDFAGNPIHEGDTIIHPSGESGVVVKMENQPSVSDEWRVDYGAGHLSRLVLQVGDKGQAVVDGRNTPKTIRRIAKC